MIDKHLKGQLDRHAEELSALECDGMTRVASYLLSEAGKAHRVCCGTISITGEGGQRFVMEPHLWVEIGGLTIDYRARMWFPGLPEVQVPHGIFPASAYPWVRYQSNNFVQAVLPGESWVSKGVYEVLVITGRRYPDIEARLREMMGEGGA